MSETIAVRFEVLYAYAEKNSLDYNDLCRVVRDAIAGGDQKAAPLPPSSVQAVDGDEPKCPRCGLSQAACDWQRNSPDPDPFF